MLDHPNQLYYCHYHPATISSDISTCYISQNYYFCNDIRQLWNSPAPKHWHRAEAKVQTRLPAWVPYHNPIQHYHTMTSSTWEAPSPDATTCTQAYSSPLEQTTSRGWLLWQRRSLQPAPHSGPGAARRAGCRWGPEGCRSGQSSTQPAQWSGHCWGPQCWLYMS